MPNWQMLAQMLEQQQQVDAGNLGLEDAQEQKMKGEKNSIPPLTLHDLEGFKDFQERHLF